MATALHKAQELEHHPGGAHVLLVALFNDIREEMPNAGRDGHNKARKGPNSCCLTKKKAVVTNTSMFPSSSSSPSPFPFPPSLVLTERAGYREVTIGNYVVLITATPTSSRRDTKIHIWLLPMDAATSLLLFPLLLPPSPPLPLRFPQAVVERAAHREPDLFKSWTHRSGE